MNKKERGLIKCLIGFVIVVILSITLYAFINRVSLNENFSYQILAYGTPALFYISIILDLIPQVLSPVIVLGTGIVAGLNPYLAIIATVLGSALGSILGFVLGKQYMYGAVDILTSKKATERLTHLTNKYGKIIVPLAAISPLPYLPVVLGAINFSKRNFIFFGLIPRAVSIVGYGLLFTLF